MNKKNKIKGIVIFLIILFLLLFLIFWIRGNVMISSHEKIGVSAPAGFFATAGFNVKQWLGINQTYYDEECLGDCETDLDSCYDDNWDEYLVCEDSCIIMFPEGDVILSESNFYTDYIEIVPSAYAIVEDPSYDEACINDCEDILDLADDACDIAGDSCYESCAIDTTELYMWDGVQPSNIKTFYQENYPNFYANSKEVCEGGFYGGTWVAESGRVGCLDFAWDDLAEGIFINMMCDSTSIKSAGEVCTTIGGTFKCQVDEITCEI